MIIVDGKKIASEILTRLKASTAPKKFFGIILVGEDPASVSFIKQKEKTAKELGVDFRLYKFPPEIKNDELRDEVRKIAEHKTCGGVVVQLPLLEQINTQYVLNAIPREKDVDVLGERALGAFYAGRNPILPPAVGVVETIIENCLPADLPARSAQAGASAQTGKLSRFAGSRVAGKIENLNVAVVGLGPLVGKPISMWLIKKVAGLFLLHKGGDFSELKKADLVITGAGSAGIIKPRMLKPDAGVIDFGYDSNKGDFDPSSLSSSSLSFYTPTPGGTGPILVAKVFENFYKLNEEK